MKVQFLHPRTSLGFEADVDLETTGKTCLDNLIKERFLEPPQDGRPYGMVLQRTNHQILPTMSMKEAEVHTGDSILILQQEQGARASVDASQCCQQALKTTVREEWSRG